MAEMTSIDEARVEAAVSALLADRERQGGVLHADQLIRVCEKRKLSVLEAVALRQKLGSHGVEVEERPTTTDAAPEADNPDEGEGAGLDLTARFLHEIGRYSLLTAEEEVALSRQVRAGLQVENETHAHAEGAVEAYAQDTLRAAKVARDALISRNLRLVVSIARDYARRSGLPLLDLVQEGAVGLHRAVDRFDHRLGFRFSTYASWWIRQAISRAIADKGRTIRLPVHIQEKLSKIRRTRRALLLEHPEREPTPREIGEQLGLEPERVQFLVDSDRDVVSLDQPVDEFETTSLVDIIASRGDPTPEQVAEHADLRGGIKTVLSTLTPRQEQIIQRRFGLRNGADETLEEISEDYEVTRERIRQVQEKALQRLRHPSRAKHLRDYYGESTKEDEAGGPEPSAPDTGAKRGRDRAEKSEPAKSKRRKR